MLFQVIIMENKLFDRKSLRIKGYDYSTPGAYFITFCTYNRKNTLSRIVGAIHESPELKLTLYGEIVDKIIKNIPSHLNVTVERYIIMPNHVHLIAEIKTQKAVQGRTQVPAKTRSVISKTVGYIKMNASKEIRRQYGDIDVWQRGYYDHIIRNAEDYEMIANYMLENPVRWELDKMYSEA